MAKLAAERVWALVQYVEEPVRPGGVPLLGLHRDGIVHEPPGELAGLTLMQVLEDWESWRPTLRTLDVDSLPVAADARLVSPLTYPRKVLCAGANYYDHAEEMGTERPDPAAEPFFFLKPPTTTVVGPRADVVIPADPAASVDWEVELGVVVAHRVRDVLVEQARTHVAGYLVANDLSARGRFPREGAVFPPFGWDWLGHKGLDGFCPLGPGLVPAWFVPDPQRLGLRLSVNDALKQDSTTANMVVGVDGLLAAASRLVTLEPGDVVLTGTPAGVGLPRRDFLHPGDVVTAEIDGLGTIANRMVAA